MPSPRNVGPEQGGNPHPGPNQPVGSTVLGSARANSTARKRRVSSGSGWALLSSGYTAASVAGWEWVRRHPLWIVALVVGLAFAPRTPGSIAAYAGIAFVVSGYWFARPASRRPVRHAGTGDPGTGDPNGHEQPDTNGDTNAGAHGDSHDDGTRDDFRPGYFVRRATGGQSPDRLGTGTGRSPSGDLRAPRPAGWVLRGRKLGQ